MSAAEAVDAEPLVVDAHTHIFTPDVVRGREAYVGRDLWFEHLYADPRALLVTSDDLLASMEAAGIDQSVVCGFPWHDPGICREQNDYLSEACAGSGGRLFWLGSVSPTHRAHASDEAARCFALGAVGIGELNADAQRFDLTSTTDLGAVVEACVAHDKPLMLHTTEPVGHSYPGKGTATPDRLVRFLENHPLVRVVAAHWGGGLPFYELMPEVARVAARVVYDSAASTYLYRFEVFRTVLDLVGPDRVLFASDFPVLRQDRFLRRVRQTPWRDSAEMARVLGENARHIYRLPEREVQG
ncbi:MAG TPA: amidohydrolase family protein [Thermomicrobiales bacterium]